MENQTPPQLFDHENFVKECTCTLEFTKEALKLKQNDKVFPELEPGFIVDKMPPQAPEQGDSLEHIYEEIKTKILPGILHWQSPKFFGYFPGYASDACLHGDIFSGGFTTPMFNYEASPAHAELQNLMIDWITQALGLPQKFNRKNKGGGVIITSASSGVFLSTHAAKDLKLQQLKIDFTDPKSLKLVGYVSKTAHVCTLRALMLKDIPYRRQVRCKLDSQVGNYIVDLQRLEEMIQQDIKNGLIPFFYGASIGSTWSGAVDQIQELGVICKKYKMWLNVDAAYLGTTWFCEEYRGNQRGLEHVDSMMINFSKLGFCGMGASLLFVGNKQPFEQTLDLHREFNMYKHLAHRKQGIIDYQNWKVDLTKQPVCFRVYFLFKMYGLKKIREALRWREGMGKYVEKLVVESKHFKLYTNRSFSLVCFELKYENSNQLTKQLAEKVSNLQEGFMSTGSFEGKNILRFATGNLNTTKEHIDKWWKKLNQVTEQLLKSKGIIE